VKNKSNSCRAILFIIITPAAEIDPIISYFVCNENKKTPELKFKGFPDWCEKGDLNPHILADTRS
jgi:hypothetical protein